MKQNLRKNTYKSIFPGCVIGLLFSLGYFIKKNGMIGFSWNLIILLLISILLSIAATTIIYSIVDGINQKEAQRTKNPLPNRIVKKSWIYAGICFMLLFIMWIPTFLALYPGLFVYDAQWQYSMYLIREVTAHHPVLHTYMLGGIMDGVMTLTGSINKAAAAYCLVQIFIMNLGETYILYVLHKEKVHPIFHVIAILFFGWFPVCDIFLMTMTKDSIFSVAVADLTVITLVLLKDVRKFFDKTGNVVIWIVFALVVLIFRNNAKYALLVVFPFFIASFVLAVKKTIDCSKKKLLLKGMIMIMTTIAIFTIYDIPITKAITVRGISTAEMLSVPCQQLARVYNYRNDELSDEQKDLIELYFSKDEGLKNYVPQQADNIKAIVDTALIKEDIPKCLKFWMQIGLEFPEEYINSFLVNTYAFWYPWPEYVVYNDGRKTYIPMFSWQPVEQNPKLTFLYEFYQEFATGRIVEGNDFVSWIFSPALYFYIFILVGGYAFGKRKRNAYVPLLFIMLLWMTYLLGPVAQVRYAVYLIYLMPSYTLILNTMDNKG